MPGSVAQTSKVRFSNLVEVIEFVDDHEYESPQKDITPPPCKSENSFKIQTMMDRIKDAKEKNTNSNEKEDKISPRQLQEDMVCPLKLNFDHHQTEADKMIKRKQITRQASFVQGAFSNAA